MVLTNKIVDTNLGGENKNKRKKSGNLGNLGNLSNLRDDF